MFVPKLMLSVAQLKVTRSLLLIQCGAYTAYTTGICFMLKNKITAVFERR